MNTTVSKPNAEKAKNYTVKQEAILTDESPFNLERAKELAGSDDFPDKSWQSIVAKVKNLGLEYIPKPPPKKRAVQATKSDLVTLIQRKLDRNLDGLEKSTRGALLNLINGLEHAIPAKESVPLPEIGDSEAS